MSPRLLALTTGFPTQPFLRRAHPFTPLTLAAVLAVLAFALPAPVGPVVILVLAIGMAVSAGTTAVISTAVLGSLPFWGFALLSRGLIVGQPLVAVALGLRITCVLLVFLCACKIVQPARLVDALLERGFPFSLAYLFAATLQAVPRIRDRGRQLLEAQRSRGLVIKGSPVRRARAVLPLTIPLILGALSEVDERAFALETRGAGQGTRRTPLHPPPDSVLEQRLRWSLVAAAALAIVLRILL